MPIELLLRDPAKQQAEVEAQTKVPEVGVVDKPIETPFGVFDVVKRLPPNLPPVYLLRSLNAAGNSLLYRAGDTFMPDHPVTAADDADALRQAFSLIWERVDAGHRELAQARARLVPTRQDTEAEAAALEG